MVTSPILLKQKHEKNVALSRPQEEHPCFQYELKQESRTLPCLTSAGNRHAR